MDENTKPIGEGYRKAILDAFEASESEVDTETRPVLPLSGSLTTETKEGEGEEVVING